MLWRESEENYLHKINTSCLELSALYNEHFIYLRAMSANFRLPAIVIGATASAVSFGTSSFPFPFQAYISIVVGGTSLLIAIINTIESYLEISKTQNAAFATLTALRKISDDIVCELSLPVEDRETAGVFFLRTIYTRYQQVLTTAPHLSMSDVKKDAIKATVNSTIQKLVYMATDQETGANGVNGVTASQHTIENLGIFSSPNIVKVNDVLAEGTENKILI